MFYNQESKIKYKNVVKFIAINQSYKKDIIVSTH